MLLREWLNQADAQLRSGPHPERARLDAEALLLHLVGKNRAWLLTHLDDNFGGCTAIQYAALLGRREKGEPIQYITGEAEFYGLPFRVTPQVLIPRPETEHLVEKVIELVGAPSIPHTGGPEEKAGSSGTVGAPSIPHTRGPQEKAGSGETVGAPSIPHTRGPQEKAGTGGTVGAPSNPRCLRNGWDTTNPSQPLRIVDVGTGSGAIAVALAHNLLAAEITATDISNAALDIARDNAIRNGVADRIRFLDGDLLAPLAGETFDLVVSNPPYVSASDSGSLAVEVRDHEPALALFAGKDGLHIYRRLIPAAFAALVPGGFLVLEIGCGQIPAVHSLLGQAGFEEIQFTSDLQGIPRVAVAQRA